jgi:excisionase family DNA binding protein
LNKVKIGGREFDLALIDMMMLFPSKEAARRLGISVTKLRKMARRNEIVSYMVGRRRMYNQWLLDMYLGKVLERQQ